MQWDVWPIQVAFHEGGRRVVMGSVIWLEAPAEQPEGRTPWCAEYDAA